MKAPHSQINVSAHRHQSLTLSALQICVVMLRCPTREEMRYLINRFEFVLHDDQFATYFGPIGRLSEQTQTLLEAFSAPVPPAMASSSSLGPCHRPYGQMRCQPQLPPPVAFSHHSPVGQFHLCNPVSPHRADYRVKRDKRLTVFLALQHLGAPIASSNWSVCRGDQLPHNREQSAVQESWGDSLSANYAHRSQG